MCKCCDRIIQKKLYGDQYWGCKITLLDIVNGLHQCKTDTIDIELNYCPECGKDLKIIFDLRSEIFLLEMNNQLDTKLWEEKTRELKRNIDGSIGKSEK